MGSHWDAVVGQELSDSWGHWAHHTVVVKKPGSGWSFVRLLSRNCILKMLENGSVDGMIHCLALGKKFVMHQTLHIKEGDQHYCSFDWNCGTFEWEHHLYVLNKLIAASLIASVILRVSGGRITRFVAELMAVQWNTFNVMSNNLQVLIIWYLTRVVLRPEVLLFYWKNMSAMKQADTTVMFKKAFNNVCTSTVAVSYDPLSPILLASSAVQDSRNFKRVPWTSRWWTYIQVEYSCD